MHDAVSCSSMGLQSFPISFDGGVNFSEDPLAVRANEAMFAMNVRAFPPHWALEKRFGRQVKWTLPVSTQRARHLWRILSATGGSIWYLAATASDMVNLSENTTLFTSATVGAPTLGTFEPVVAEMNATAWIQGVNPPQKWGPVNLTPGPATTVAWANSPPVGQIIVSWRGRIIITGSFATPGRLWYSDRGNPESPAASYGNNFIDVTSSEDPRITAVAVLGENLLVFTQDSVLRVFDPSTFANQVINRGTGATNMDAVAVVGNECYFMDSNGGLYKTNGRTVERIDAGKLERYFRAIAQSGSWHLASGGDERLLVQFGSSTGTTFGFLEYVPKTGAWYPHNFRSTFVWTDPVGAVPSFQVFQPEVIIGDRDAGTISRVFSGLDDVGVAINGLWQTGWQGVQEIEKFERIRRVNMYYKGLVKMDLYADFQLGTPAASFTTPEVGIENATPISRQALNFGSGPDGSWQPYVFTRWRPEVRSRYRSIKFSDNTLGKFFNIRDAEYVLRGGKEH